jgi:hypothetical protein
MITDNIIHLGGILWWIDIITLWALVLDNTIYYHYIYFALFIVVLFLAVYKSKGKIINDLPFIFKKGLIELFTLKSLTILFCIMALLKLVSYCIPFISLILKILLIVIFWYTIYSIYNCDNYDSLLVKFQSFITAAALRAAAQY